MSHLSKLTLTDKSPTSALSPVDRKRRKLLEQLDHQLAAAKLTLENKPALRQVQHWVVPQDGGEKQLVTKEVPIRKWWWVNATGQFMLSLRQGNRVMEISPGKTAIEVGYLEDLPTVLETVRQAVETGELDEALKASPFVRPLPKKKDGGPG